MSLWKELNRHIKKQNRERRGWMSRLWSLDLSSYKPRAKGWAENVLVDGPVWWRGWKEEAVLCCDLQWGTLDSTRSMPPFPFPGWRPVGGCMPFASPVWKWYLNSLFCQLAAVCNPSRLPPSCTLSLLCIFISLCCCASLALYSRVW